MNVSRRQFLKLASFSTLGAVACNFFPEREFIAQSPVLLPEDLVTGTDNWYTTICKQCPEAEGLVVRVMEGRAKKVRGNPVYPTNQGAHSVRCEAGLQALYHPDRIAGPLLRVGPRGEGLYKSIGWNEALNRLRDEMLKLPNRDQMLMVTEPLRGSLAYLVSQFTKTFQSRHLAFQPIQEAAFGRITRDMLGQQMTPTFDVKNARFLLSFGADFLATWTAPVQYSRGFGEFRQGMGRERGSFVHVDPRFSMTAANADEWIPVKPGFEGKLALSIAHVIMSEGLVDAETINTMTNGQGPSALDQFAPNRIANDLGIPPLRGRDPVEVIKELARDFASHQPHTLAIGGGSASAHTNGMFNLSAIYALNFLTRSVGHEGGILFNPQPPIAELETNLEAGTIEEWSSTTNDIGSDIKLLLVRGANPVYGLPGNLDLATALNRDDIFIASFSSFQNETTEMADLILPDRMPLEDWGDDIPQPGPGFQVVGMQQPVVNPLPETSPMSFGDILLRMAQELEINTNHPLDKTLFLDVLKNHANKIYELDRGSIQEHTFEAFWIRLLQTGCWVDDERKGEASRQAPSLVDIASKAQDPTITGPLVSVEQPGQVFSLIPFQSLSLTDGQGAHLPWLQATPDPITSVTWTTWVEINSNVAAEIGVKEGDFVTVEGANGGTFEAQIYHHPAVPPDVVSIPLGQGHSAKSQYSEGKGANVLKILGLQTDHETGTLAWASTRVRITPTGERKPIPKFEGIVPAYQTSQEEAVIKVTKE